MLYVVLEYCCLKAAIQICYLKAIIITCLDKDYSDGEVWRGDFIGFEKAANSLAG